MYFERIEQFPIKLLSDVVNVGLGGACLLVDEALAVDDTVSLSFTAPTLWDPLVLRARDHLDGHHARGAPVAAVGPVGPDRDGVKVGHGAALSLRAERSNPASRHWIASALRFSQ